MRGVVASPERIDEGRWPGLEAAHADWRTSSFSAETQCVEVAISSKVVLVRNTRDRGQPFLAFGVTPWAAFTAAVRDGEFTR
jgi:hypothetical protein